MSLQSQKETISTDMQNSATRKVSVVIPIYKETLTPNEEISLHRCFSFLKKHPITVIRPPKIRLDFLRVKSYQFEEKEFSDYYFNSIASYNRLMLSQELYKAFLDYRYMLIYQTDAFVFQDELDKWCDQGYDYIGAPWLGMTWPKKPRSFIDRVLEKSRITRRLRKTRLVGNGGFSLRKVSTSLLALKILKDMVNDFKDNEDHFWALDAARLLPFFKTPSVNVAVGFAFELNPRLAVELNHGNLPFGCHAWEKYDPEFLRPIFSKLGYSF